MIKGLDVQGLYGLMVPWSKIRWRGKGRDGGSLEMKGLDWDLKDACNGCENEPWKTGQRGGHGPRMKIRDGWVERRVVSSTWREVKIQFIQSARVFAFYSMSTLAQTRRDWPAGTIYSVAEYSKSCVRQQGLTIDIADASNMARQGDRRIQPQLILAIWNLILLSIWWLPLF